MQINVAQLLKEPIGSFRHYQIAKTSDLSSVSEGSCQVEGEVKLLRTDRSILASGTLMTEVTMLCSRCLSPFNLPLTLKIEEEYFPTIDVVSGAHLSVPADSSDLTIDENHIIDLTEAVRQYMLLATPMKPLCRTDCAGLCPQCGYNLNYGPCNCTVSPVDTRWVKLRELME